MSQEMSNLRRFLAHFWLRDNNYYCIIKLSFALSFESELSDSIFCSFDEIATKLGVGVRTVKRRIKQMTNIVYVGSGYSGHWEIKG